MSIAAKIVAGVGTGSEGQGEGGGGLGLFARRQNGSDAVR
jgi:hypothetical protein